eukprot:scaffold1019_cov255-Pinguiococcus_pyrenoidosus.AAC.25
MAPSRAEPIGLHTASVDYATQMAMCSAALRPQDAEIQTLEDGRHCGGLRGQEKRAQLRVGVAASAQIQDRASSGWEWLCGQAEAHERPQGKDAGGLVLSGACQVYTCMHGADESLSTLRADVVLYAAVRCLGGRRPGLAFHGAQQLGDVEGAGGQADSEERRAHHYRHRRATSTDRVGSRSKAAL